MTDQFPEIISVLGGELVVPNANGKSDFEELRRRNLLQRPRMIAEASAGRPAVLVLFDVLELDGHDLRRASAGAS